MLPCIPCKLGYVTSKNLQISGTCCIYFQWKLENVLMLIVLLNCWGQQKFFSLKSWSAVNIVFMIFYWWFTAAGLTGLWLGIATGSLLCALALFVYLYRVDWRAMSEQARELVCVHTCLDHGAFTHALWDHALIQVLEHPESEYYSNVHREREKTKCNGTDAGAQWICAMSFLVSDGGMPYCLPSSALSIYCHVAFCFHRIWSTLRWRKCCWWWLTAVLVLFAGNSTVETEPLCSSQSESLPAPWKWLLRPKRWDAAIYTFWRQIAWCHNDHTWPTQHPRHSGMSFQYILIFILNRWYRRWSGQQMLLHHVLLLIIAKIWNMY